ncbi:hypothetical protein M5689_023201 [Euphorbia peplus]|nr:hypothetical protein M5689_023201 [Euphorbia peplus]
MESIIKEEDAEHAGTHVLEFPSMNKLTIRECPSFKSFILGLTREHKEDSDIHFSHKVFPNLKELSLDIKSMETSTALLNKYTRIWLGFDI